MSPPLFHNYFFKTNFSISLIGKNVNPSYRDCIWNTRAFISNYWAGTQVFLWKRKTKQKTHITFYHNKSINAIMIIYFLFGFKYHQVISLSWNVLQRQTHDIWLSQQCQSFLSSRECVGKSVGRQSNVRRIQACSFLEVGVLFYESNFISFLPSVTRKKRYRTVANSS